MQETDERGHVPIGDAVEIEGLPSVPQLGTAVFGILLALGFAWIGVALWQWSPAAAPA